MEILGSAIKARMQDDQITTIYRYVNTDSANNLTKKVDYQNHYCEKYLPTYLSFELSKQALRKYVETVHGVLAKR